MKKIKDTTVCVFAFNREHSLKNTLNDLTKNINFEKYTCHVFVDFPKNKKDLKIHKSIVNIVKTYNKKNNIKIISRKKNYGLNKNITTGINYIKKKYHKFIILEDDLRLSKNYLNFMQTNLNKFENNNNIFTITGYMYPKKIFKLKLKNNSIFLTKRPNSWAWGSWSNKWNQVNFSDQIFKNIYRNQKKMIKLSHYGSDLEYILRDTLRKKIDSWAIKWTIYHILHNKFCIYPFQSLVNEEGYKSNPTNNKFKINKFNHNKLNYFNFGKIFHIQNENKKIRNMIKKIYDFTLYKRIIKKFL